MFWRYKPRDWNLICDSCSKKIKASTAKKRWDGFLVCPDCWEPRHSQDFVRAKQDKITVPYSRPIPTETFISVPYTGAELTCTPIGSTGAADYCVADCARADETLPGIL
jgi:hypothetical protein